MSTNIKYFITAIGAFLLGLLYYKGRQKAVLNTDFNKTIVKQKDGKYFLIFNSLIVLSREITKTQYDEFLKQYPSGKADSNVLDKFSPPPSKYTIENGKYFEYKWNGSSYGNAIEITKEEYGFLTKKDDILSLIDDFYI